ncbi:MAG: sigma 54-interacting transcriptional regulator [Desulfobacterota bacterium]|jgi:PAS domain S-box-containing protein|nr:sigma 54-interacting transcriptional regulator [Thermodesulfobacteriota bacterium]
MWALALGVLYLTSLHSYLLFHTLAEVFSAAVSVGVFMLVWNLRRSIDNGYLLFVGIAYLFVAGLDLVHTLAFKGMGVFEGHDENLQAQLWVGARYLQSLSLLVASFLIGKQVNPKLVLAGIAAAVSLFLGMIFYWNIFPTCFVAGEGLTPFQKYSEYAVGIIFLASIALLVKKRETFDTEVLRLLVASITLTILSEMCFSAYVDVYGLTNFLGHFLKIIALYCIYKAIIELGMSKPFAVLFRNLKESEESLKKAHEVLERRVEERTGNLARTCEQLSRQIGERKRVEEALRQSEMKYRIVAENNYGWEWWRSPEGAFVYVSPSCKEITYHSPEEFVSDPDLLFRIIHPDDLPAFASHVAEIEKKGLSGETEFRIIRPDRTIRWIAHACLPVFDEEGQNLGRRGSNRDITERKEAEKLLKAGEERHRTLIETMNEGFGVADEKGVWTYVNEKFCKMVGYSYDEIVGHPVYDWLDEANRRIYEEQSTRRRKGEQQSYEISGIRKDGSKIYALVSPKAIFGETGEFQGSFAVITDITERRNTEESLRNALSEIRTLKDRLEAENIYFRQEIKTRHRFDHIIGQSNAFKYVLYRAEQVAPTNTTVLLLGETGTGKGLIATAIHQMSPRKDRPPVTVNCAALPANLIESELFGREKGAFTGADTRQLGRFDVANGSTICLDEVGELPLEVQAKLLRVIQDGEFERLGSSRTVKVDVRIVATTNRNLEEEVRKGRFRQDLYYRLNVFPLTVPPLRRRKEDIPLLVQVFTERYARELRKEITAISKETMKAFQDYDWPGNVRELENVIERAVILCTDPILQLAEKLENPAVSVSSGLKTLEETEREQILKTLSQTRWLINGSKGAAAILGLHPSTLRARMQKLGIHRPEIQIPE